MDWIGIPEDTTGYDGFVYRITCLDNGKKYIGKKLFKRALKRKPLKGKTRARRDKVDSDWKDYYGSCTELLEDIKKYGKERFHREAVWLGKGRGLLSYVELHFQITEQAVWRDDYYNAIINVRLHKNVFPKGFRGL